ncbi:MAG TPA: PQQ-dependent sugar dehydrogenase, partial [Steroidobacter sp.]|nr:PQQ-dependent sugar dehydrogenase [Steroidobacter sp.]
MKTPAAGLSCLAMLLAGCSGPPAGAAEASNEKFTVTAMAQFEEPWAMTFLPDGRLLVSEKKGALKVYQIAGQMHDVRGVPDVDYGGQGGFGDVVLHPQFARNKLVYLSYVEAGRGDTRGAVVARATLDLDDDGGGELRDLSVIWRQTPKVTGRGHYSHRIAFGPDGYLWITSGERQKFDPAQDMQSNLGKILRLNDDGSTPADNPFASQGAVAAQ